MRVRTGQARLRDITTIRLSAALVAGPPLELWPQVVTRVPIPGDVEQRILLEL